MLFSIAGDQFANTEFAAAQIDQQIADDLAGAVIGDLTAAIDLNHRNIARRQHMLGLAGLALREYARMLQTTRFHRGVFSSRASVKLRIASQTV